MFILFVSLAQIMSIRADNLTPHQPVPPGIPRARPPFSPQKRSPPAHDPMSYAKTHGLSLETDEEGQYRIGGTAQEGYESLYFEAEITTPPDPQPRRRQSRSSEAISKEIEDQILHDSTKIMLSFEPEGSGDEVIIDTVLEIVPEDERDLQFVDGSPFVGNFDPLAAWKTDKLKRLAGSEKFSPQFGRELITVSRKSARIINNKPVEKIPIAGKENTVRIPCDRLLFQHGDNTAPQLPKLRRFQIENTAVLNPHPEALMIMGAGEFRDRSMRALRRGRGSWNRRIFQPKKAHSL